MIIAPGKIGNDNMIRRIPANNFFKPFAPRQTKKKPIDHLFLRSVAHSPVHHYPEGCLAARNSEVSPNILSLPRLPPLQNRSDHTNRNMVSIVDFSKNASNFTAYRSYTPLKSYAKQSVNKDVSSNDKQRSEERALKANQLQDSNDSKNLRIEPVSNNKFLLLPKNNLSQLEKIMKKKLAKNQELRRKNESVQRLVKKVLQFKETSEPADSRNISASQNKILHRIDASNFDIVGW